MSKTSKIYCYVDESGQDTKGKLFIVSVVVAEKNKDLFQKEIEKIERDSKKGKSKWGKTKFISRISYLNAITSIKKCKFCICFSKYKTMDFDLATIQTISKTIHSKFNNQNYKALIYVDALAKSKRNLYAKELRNLGVKTQKIMGVTKDENNSMIRLADSVCGWIRDVIEQDRDDDLSFVFRKAIKSKILVEV